ncbi:MAG: hypothetical protein ACOVQA_15325 [Thermoflexibacteraceae bacterium]
MSWKGAGWALHNLRYIDDFGVCPAITPLLVSSQIMSFVDIPSYSINRLLFNAY